MSARKQKDENLLVLRFGEGYSSDAARGKVVCDVIEERESHAERGWNNAHDDAEGIAHLVLEARHHLSPVPSVWTILPKLTLRKELVKAASLLLAALETLDREAEQEVPDPKASK